MRDRLHFVDSEDPGRALCGNNYNWYTDSEDEFWNNIEDSCDDCGKVLDDR